MKTTRIREIWHLSRVLEQKTIKYRKWQNNALKRENNAKSGVIWQKKPKISRNFQDHTKKGLTKTQAGV